MLEHKIQYIIEEAQSKTILDKIAAIPGNLIQSIKAKYRKLIEEANIAPAPKIQGSTNMMDTCYSAVMKLIGKKNIPNKYPNASQFLAAYRKKGGELAPVKDINIDNLKPGTIILYQSSSPLVYKANRSYGEFGLVKEEERSGGHMGIYLGKEKGKYLILHNTWIDDENTRPGSDLELAIEKKTKRELHRKNIKALDYNTIKGM